VNAMFSARGEAFILILLNAAALLTYTVSFGPLTVRENALVSWLFSANMLTILFFARQGKGK
jgi:hypothetical protein